MKLQEIFDSKIENFQWQTNTSNYKLGYFEVDSIPFTIQIENKILVKIPNSKGYKTAEVSYRRTDKDTDESFSTTGETGVNVFSLYGVLINALVPIFKDYDMFYFEVNKKHSNNIKEFNQKIKLNRAMIQKIGSKTQEHTFTYEYDKGTTYEFLISKVKIQDDNFKNPIEESIKEFMASNPVIQQFRTSRYKGKI